MMHNSVDLPPPLGPSSAVSDPSGMSIDTSSSAVKPASRLVMLRTVIAITSRPWVEGA